MSNKAETVLVITKSAENPVISEVHALHIREKEFKPFAFSVDDEGLPVMVDNYSFDGSVRPKARSSFMDLSIEQHREHFPPLSGTGPSKVSRTCCRPSWLPMRLSGSNGDAAS